MEGDWKPNLFVPAFPKCGTSALAQYLGQHPEIYVIESKEPGTLYHWKKMPKFIVPGGMKQIGSIAPIEAYKEAFSKNKHFTYRVDASQSYSFDKEFVKHLYSFNPEAKVLVMIRNQLKRAVSAYAFTYPFHGLEFEDWVNKILRKELSDFLFMPYLEKLFKYFGKNVLVLDQSDLKEKPQEVMNRVFEFLNLDTIEVKKVSVNRSFISPREGKLTKAVKTGVFRFVTLSTKIVKDSLKILGLDKSWIYLKLKDHHPLKYVPDLLLSISVKSKKDTVSFPKDIEDVLMSDYKEASRYKLKI